MTFTATFEKPPRIDICRNPKSVCFIAISVVPHSGHTLHTGNSLAAIVDLHDEYAFGRSVYLIGDSIQRYNLPFLYTLEFIEEQIVTLQSLITSKKSKINTQSQNEEKELLVEIKDLEGKIKDLEYLVREIPKIALKEIKEEDIKKFLSQEIINKLSLRQETVASLKSRLDKLINYPLINNPSSKQNEIHALIEIIAYYYNDLAINLGKLWYERNKDLLSNKDVIYLSDIESEAFRYQELDKTLTINKFQQRMEDLYYGSSKESEIYVKGLNKDIDEVLLRLHNKSEQINDVLARQYIKAYIEREIAIIGHATEIFKGKYISYPSEKLQTLANANEYISRKININELIWLPIKVKRPHEKIVKNGFFSKKSQILQESQKPSVTSIKLSTQLPSKVDVQKITKEVVKDVAQRFLSIYFDLARYINLKREWNSAQIHMVTVSCGLLKDVAQNIVKNDFLLKSFPNTNLYKYFTEEDWQQIIGIYVELLDDLLADVKSGKGLDQEVVNEYKERFQFAAERKNMLIDATEFLNEFDLEIVEENIIEFSPKSKSSFDGNTNEITTNNSKFNSAKVLDFGDNNLPLMSISSGSSSNKHSFYAKSNEDITNMSTRSSFDSTTSTPIDDEGHDNNQDIDMICSSKSSY